MPDTVTLATRKSPLALAQARLAEEAVREAFPEAEVVQSPMTTTGDQRLVWSLEEKGGKGLFTKERNHESPITLRLFVIMRFRISGLLKDPEAI